VRGFACVKRQVRIPRLDCRPPEWPCFEECPGLGEDIGPQIRQLMKLTPAVGEILQKYGDVVAAIELSSVLDG
jgi:hypothetical protein